jgi:hypothetical protein
MNRSWLTSIGNRPRGKKLANSFSRFENKNRILSWNLPIKYFEMICWNVSWHLDRNSFFKNIYMHWYDKNDSNGKWIHRARGREKNFEMDKKTRRTETACFIGQVTLHWSSNFGLSSLRARVLRSSSAVGCDTLSAADRNASTWWRRWLATDGGQGCWSSLSFEASFIASTPHS